LNYFGLFEVEFIAYNGGWALIDFNPRLYHQIGLDIRRGMPLPLLAFLDATSQRDALKQAVEKANAEYQEGFVFCDRFTLNAILLAQAVFSRVPRLERERWRHWLLRHASHLVDVAFDKDDRLPGVVHATSEIFFGLKALRRFLFAKSGTSFTVPSAASRYLSP
jgi:hypothetical protein